MLAAYREALASVRSNPCPRTTVIPPNRLEAGVWDHLVSLAGSTQPDPRATLLHELRQLLGCEHVSLAPSARCAIAQVLALLPHREVVMPAFNCDVVKSAVEAAGKTIVYVDVAPGSVNATAAEFARAAQPGRILLATHQFGVPADIEAICALSKSRGCVVVEDAACSFGAVYNGKLLGTFGDVGVFSFESWKRLPAFRGGAIAVNNPQQLDPGRLASEPFVDTTVQMPAREIVSALVRIIATTPWLYGRFVLPVLLRSYIRPADHREPHVPGASVSVTSGPAFTREMHPYQARLLLRLLGRLESIRSHVAQLTRVYSEAFRHSPVMTFLPPVCDAAGLLRYPIAFPETSRADVLRRALKRGLYLETEFEDPLPVGSEREHFPNAVWTGRNLVLLPLYTSLSLTSAAWLAGQINEIASEAR